MRGSACEKRTLELRERQVVDFVAESGRESLSNTIYLSITFRKSTAPPKLQLDLLISNSEQKNDDFVGELTF